MHKRKERKKDALDDKIEWDAGKTKRKTKLKQRKGVNEYFN